MKHTYLVLRLIDCNQIYAVGTGRLALLLRVATHAERAFDAVLAFLADFTTVGGIRVEIAAFALAAAEAPGAAFAARAAVFGVLGDVHTGVAAAHGGLAVGWPHANLRIGLAAHHPMQHAIARPQRPGLPFPFHRRRRYGGILSLHSARSAHERRREKDR